MSRRRSPELEAADGPGAIALPHGAVVAGNSAPGIVADTDAQAVAAWLSEYQQSPSTRRAYRREAERLLLWLGEHALTLSALRRHHLDDYESFLGDPSPRERWIGPVRPRTDPRWRPFRGPLSPASRRQSMVILQAMMAWLGEAGWVSHNPFRLMRDKGRRLDNRRARIERYLERPLWDWLWQWLCEQDNKAQSDAEGREARRMRLVFGFAYLLAPRIGEMSAARMDDFIVREGRWWWNVVGKGGKAASIPVPSDLLDLLGESRLAWGLPARPAGDRGPVLRRRDGLSPLGDNQLYRLIRGTFQRAADALEAEEGSPQAVARLREATPHWLRHTALTHQAQAGVELRYLAETARHSRLDTTARYLHAEDEEWHRQQSAHQLPDAAER
ncbi:tyrosine-type recombinase/integrase [Halomonas sp. V046]|uniref:tyrosine-type recombinase/integrase n=1 Tax=Halomonas sp. V046 TaxID=3459611 RepID=UPI004043F964